MMIFEDKSDDLLSLLFKQSYNKDISDKFYTVMVMAVLLRKSKLLKYMY